MNSSRIYSSQVRFANFRVLPAEYVWKSPFWNLLIVKSGTLTIRYGDQVLSSAVMAFLTDEEITLTPADSCELFFLCADPLAVYDAFDSEQPLRGALTGIPETAAAHLLSYAEELAETLAADPDEEALHLSSLWLSILQTIRGFFPCPSRIPVPLVPLSPHRAALFGSVFRYILDQDADNCSQAGCAKTFGITPQYLGRFLRETTGKTFRELREETLSARESAAAAWPHAAVTEAFLLPGIPSSASGYTRPAQYNRPSPESHKISASIDGVHHFRRLWKKLINLGYANNLRNFEADGLLNLARMRAGFTYGRICRIVDLIGAYTIGEQVTYDFTRAFSLLDRVTDSGIIPYLELGNKSFTIQETSVTGIEPSTPKDTRQYYAELLRILPEFIRACINRYGQSRFDRWRFEISYMYSSDAEKERLSIAQFVAMFRRIYRIIRSYSTCAIGGPGFNDWQEEGRIHQTMRLFMQEEPRPDFYSVYIYPMEMDERGNPVLTKDPDLLTDRIRSFSSVVRKYAPNAEIWITEFNSNLSSRNYLNDSSYQAAFLIKMLLAADLLPVTAMGYYLLSDAPLRYLDSLDFLFGGWGLISDRGIPKPSFHAYACMSMLGEYNIRNTGDCLITANSHGSFQILLYRYRHPEEYYLRNNVEREDLAAYHNVFGTSDAERFTIHLTGIQQGTYILKEYRIDAAHSNIFLTWKGLGYLHPPGQDIIEEMRADSALIPKMTVFEYKDEEPFTLTAELNDNEVRLFVAELYTSRHSADEWQ